MEAQPEAAGSAAVSPETEAKLSKARVEKLKRRIIRAVAVKTSQNPDEKEMQNMWEMMNRSSKCDCKVLWKHMRAVTLKKLKRLLPAEDRIENITAIARLTITDWLLFDLVLVHENIDVIGRDIWEKDGEEPEPLMELFFLVDEYKIEQLKGRTELIDAWLKLTREYNDGGRKCSPMLLQRRWYQMKEATRKRFYDFWGHYRGNPTHMSKAKRFQPTALQVDIVRKNKMLIVSSFTEWNELIANGRVILANEFDDRINALRKGTELTDAGPELEVIEQEVETISLEGDSDEGDLRDDSNENSLQNDVTVKREPEDNDLIEIHENNIDILRSINIPCETPFGNNEEEPPPLVVLDDKQLETNEETCLIDDLDQRKNKECADDSDIVEESCNIENEVSAFAKTVSDTATKEVCNDLEANIVCDESSDSDNVELTDIFNSLISQLEIETPFLNKSPEVDIIKLENYIETENNADEQAEPCNEQTNIDYLPRIENVTSMAQSEPTTTENQVKSNLDQETNELAVNKDCRLTETNDFTNNSVINDLAKVIIKKIANDRELLGNFEELPSDIHFVDDGIVLDDDVEDVSDFKVKEEVEESIEETNDEFSGDTQSGKIDLKLLLFPTVYTKKLDHMDVFKFIEYDHIRDGRIIEFASIESKPIDRKSIKLEDISSSKNDEHHSNLGSDSSDQEDTLFETEHQQNEITTEIELQSNQESGSSDEEEIPLNTFKNRVHIKSWLLKKPCVQNYNPIQLCKNPDFNTRLKRLTAGFLSYERNRKYLKRCHPLTIDLHKAFEDKLTNNTLYLKGVDLISNEPAPSTEDTVIQPIPISSPSFPQNVSTDNEADVIDIISNSPLVCERNKIINLPDITEIRRLNQNLLTAEVAPLQIAAASPPEMNAPDVLNFEPIDQNKPTTQEVHNTSKINSLILGSDSCGPKQDGPNVDKSFIASSHTRNSEDSGKIDQTISESNKSISGKKQQQKPKPHRSHNAYKSASWITKSIRMREEEFLLASDTVDKMLFLFTGEDIRKKKTITRVMKHFNETRDVRENSLKVLTEELNLKESTPISVTKNEEPVKSSSQDQTALKPKKRKIYCCWASKKYAHPNLKQRHPCKKPLCTCCCKEKLIGKVILEDKKQQPRNDLIILSDEEEKDPVNMQTPKKVCIVNVVNTNSLKEFPKATSIVIDGKSNKVNVPNHIIRNNDSASNENDVINCEPSTLCTNNINSMPNQSNLQIVHNITDAADNSSELPLQLTVGLNETVVTQGDTRVLNTEQLMIPSIPPLMESLTPCQESRNIKITVKANQPNENTLPNHSISYTLSDPTPQTTLLPPLVVPKPKKAGRKSISPRIKTTLSYAIPPKPLELPNRTVRVKVKNQEELSSSPIFVGPNKILLSTVKSPFPPRMSIDPPKISLPNGVHFVLLTNNELALSIEPGVELNNNQLSHLQSVIQTLQHFLGVPSKCTNVIDNTPIVIDDDENQKPQDLDSKDTERNKENDNQLDTENEIESINHLETYTQTDERTEESSIISIEKNSFASNDKPENVEHNKDISSTISNTEREIVNDNDNSEKTSNDISRKTILSDLMEMSGISEEDAKLPETPVLPAIAPDFGLTPLEKGQDKSLAEMHPDILRLFNTPIALASLARRPDLSIITTYSDLKYSFYKEAKFFKLDVTTGEIVRINVFIKNKDNIRSSLNPPKRNKTQLIDLTDDDSENDIVIDSEVPNTEAENSVITADTHSEAKPIKLFRAMHPSLLRNNLKCKGSELIPSAVRSGSLLKKLDGKNILKIVNIDRRKQNLKVIKPINMETVVDEEKLQEPSQLEVVHTNECPSDDSDDEPLAKISKRNKQEQNAVTNDQHQNIESTESIDIPMESAAFVEVANPMMYEALDPEFESLENDCEEDCILGV